MLESGCDDFYFVPAERPVLHHFSVFSIRFQIREVVLFFKQVGDISVTHPLGFGELVYMRSTYKI